MRHRGKSDGLDLTIGLEVSSLKAKSLEVWGAQPAASKAVPCKPVTYITWQQTPSEGDAFRYSSDESAMDKVL